MSYENEEREEDGISIGDIFRMIFSQKILALIVAVVLFVLCTVVLYFGYSASNVTYSVTFTLTLLNADSSSTYYSLPDDTVFYYSDYVSEDVIKEVVESNSDTLGYVDYEDMVQKNCITLTRVAMSEDEEETFSVLKMNSSNIFTITAEGKYFKTDEDATLFLTTLAQYPITSYIRANKSADYTSYLSLSDFQDALTFADQISYIRSQISYISSLYSSLPSTASAGVTMTVATAISNFNAYVSRLDLDALSDEIETYYYCKDYTVTLEKYQNQLVKTNGLYDQYNDVSAAYEELTTALSSVNASNGNTDSETLYNLISQMTSLKQQIRRYENYISAYYEVEEYDADTGFIAVDELTGRLKLDYDNVKTAQVTATETFAQEIEKIFVELTEDNEYITKYVELNELVCNNVASVNYADSSKVVSDAPLGLMIVLVISFVIAIVVACIAAYAVAATKKSKAANEAKNNLKEEKTVADKE